MTRPFNSPSSFAQDLLNWYDRHQRVLPWRHRDPNTLPDPYGIWISEVMLQQTTVTTVKPYFERFIELWPTVDALAAAPLDDILHAWQGLGYYSRARNMHACAQQIMQLHGGVFPQTKIELLKLPGIGPYTAAAIEAMAFNQPAVVIDGNVERIIARLDRLILPTQAPSSHMDHLIREKAENLTPSHRWGEYAQAMMDLGSMICTPRTPQCGICPVQTHCRSWGKDPENFPIKGPNKLVKPIRHTTFYWITNTNGDVMIVRRPPRGLLGGMMGIPSLRCTSLSPSHTSRFAWHIRHTFSHFHLYAQVEILNNPLTLPGPLDSFLESLWVPPEALKYHAFPTLMGKVINYIRNT